MTRLLALLLAMAGTAATAAPRLSARLAEVPFCYQCGASRVWPLLSSPLRAGEAVVLSVQRNGAELARAAGG
ncbi:MAG: hypothetical protein NTY38_21220, partial [Acidobacteria bacterium]|nr:hypothetical protein [Acidobacteriota bacterium]